MFRIVVLASGNGSNLQAIIDAVANEKCRVQIAAVISDKPNAYALTRARDAHIPAHPMPPQPNEPMDVFNERLANLVRALDADLIVLAGYMRILSPAFVRSFEGKIINIHPALLPKYKGLHTHTRVLEAGDKQHGATVHFVSEGVDEGAIIAHVVVPVKKHDTAERLRQRVLAQEHRLLPLVIRWFAEGKVVLRGNHVHIHGIACNTMGLKVSF